MSRKLSISAVLAMIFLGGCQTLPPNEDPDFVGKLVTLSDGFKSFSETPLPFAGGTESGGVVTGVDPVTGMRWRAEGHNGIGDGSPGAYVSYSVSGAKPSGYGFLKSIKRQLGRPDFVAAQLLIIKRAGKIQRLPRVLAFWEVSKPQRGYLYAIGTEGGRATLQVSPDPLLYPLYGKVIPKGEHRGALAFVRDPNKYAELDWNSFTWGEFIKYKMSPERILASPAGASKALAEAVKYLGGVSKAPYASWLASSTSYVRKFRKDKARALSAAAAKVRRFKTERKNEVTNLYILLTRTEIPNNLRLQAHLLYRINELSDVSGAARLLPSYQKLLGLVVPNMAFLVKCSLCKGTGTYNAKPCTRCDGHQYRVEPLPTYELEFSRLPVNDISRFRLRKREKAFPRLALVKGRPMLKLGDKNAYVRALKEVLFRHRLRVPMSREFDSATRDALLRFQTKHGIPQTGVADEKTWEYLDLSRFELKLLAQ